MRKILWMCALAIGAVVSAQSFAEESQVILTCTLKSPDSGTPVIGGYVYQLVRKNNKHFIVIGNPSVGPSNRHSEFQVTHYGRYGNMISAISGPTRSGYALMYFNANGNPQDANAEVKVSAVVDINMFRNEVSAPPMNETELSCELNADGKKGKDAINESY